MGRVGLCDPSSTGDRKCPIRRRATGANRPRPACRDQLADGSAQRSRSQLARRTGERARIPQVVEWGSGLPLRPGFADGADHQTRCPIVREEGVFHRTRGVLGAGVSQIGRRLDGDCVVCRGFPIIRLGEPGPFALPAGCRRIQAIHDAGGSSWLAFRGPGPVRDWQTHFEDWFASTGLGKNAAVVENRNDLDGDVSFPATPRAGGCVAERNPNGFWEGMILREAVSPANAEN